MPEPSARRSTFVPHFLRHIELYLTGAGIVVILLVPQFFALEQRAWAVAVSAVLVGVVHGLLFWLVRRRQRLIREAVVEDLRRMLQDRINNKLQVLLLHASATGAESAAEDGRRLREISESIREVSVFLDRLSLQSLGNWRQRYGVRPSDL